MWFLICIIWKVAMESVSVCEFETLFRQLAKRSYSANESNELILDIQKKVENLFAKDYHYRILKNSNGELLTSYPSRILLLEGEKNSFNVHESSDSQNGNEVFQVYDLPKLRNLIIKSKCARVRERFPIPVILYEGRNICRSSTTSCSLEVLGRKSADYIYSSSLSLVSATFGQGNYEEQEEEDAREQALYEEQQQAATEQAGSFPIYTSRHDDITLLKTFNVSHICDLMVEKKKVKYLCNVSSSEKVDRENRYDDFTLWSLPYPGCEFFKEYHDNKYSGEGLVFQYDQDYVDAILSVPSEPFLSNLGIDFNCYKTWDLITLTQNYLKLILMFLMEGKDSVLVHCISGWDRTPLFISLLRMSLWADGKVHPSLTPLEMLYLTLSYDWYLFGHQFSNRFIKGEEVMHFCFHFLTYIVGEDFSVIQREETEPVNLPELHAVIPGDGSGDSSVIQENSASSNDSSSTDSKSQDDKESQATVSKLDPEGGSDTTNVHPDSSVMDSVLDARPRGESGSSSDSWSIIRESESKSFISPEQDENLNLETNKELDSYESFISKRREKLHSILTMFHDIYVAVMGKR